MKLTELLTDLHRYLLPLFSGIDHPDAPWSTRRRTFVLQLVLAVIAAGTTVLSEVVRRMPGAKAIRHRYKAVDRMLGDVDLVPLAAEQTAVLGRDVGRGWVIALDLSDIAKPEAKKMESIAQVRDGSTGAFTNGYELVTACAFNLEGRAKAQPLPLLFEVFSSAEGDHKSQNTTWLDAIERLHAVAPAATIVIDRAGDNGFILRKFLDLGQPFVARLQTGDGSRHLLFGADSRARVRDAWKEATDHGELVAERLSDDGRRSPYRCAYASMKVRLPARPETLWLCVFDSDDHAEPLVVLTSRPAATPAQTAQVLAEYFGRWAVEDLHRWSKQELGLEQVRLLTWTRLKNVVATVWLAMGFTASLCRGPEAEAVLRVLEARGQQLRKPHQPGHFWGYAVLRGARAILAEGAGVLRLLALSRPPKPDRQLALPGVRA